VNFHPLSLEDSPSWHTVEPNSHFSYSPRPAKNCRSATKCMAYYVAFKLQLLSVSLPIKFKRECLSSKCLMTCGAFWRLHKRRGGRKRFLNFLYSELCSVEEAPTPPGFSLVCAPPASSLPSLPSNLASSDLGSCHTHLGGISPLKAF
jgi:hypothetical protein